MKIADVAVEKPPSLRHDRQYLLYWVAYVISLTGSAVTFVVIPIVLYQITGSSLWTSAVFMAQALPYLFFGLLAGAIADRVNRRALMVAADTINAVLVLSVPLAYVLGVLSAPYVLAVAFAVRVLAVVYDAANFGALPSLIGTQRIATAQASVFGATMIIEVVAPGLVAAALMALPPAALLMVDTASYVASALLLGRITRPLGPAEMETPSIAKMTDITEGLLWMWRNTIVRIQTLLSTALLIAQGLVYALLLPWADHVLRMTSQDWRTQALYAAWALGGILGSAVFRRLLSRYGYARITALGLAIATGAAISCGLITSWPWAVVALAVWGMAYILVALSAITSRQKLAPDRFRSRVNTSARMLTYGFGFSLGALAGGVINQFAGPQFAFFAAAVLLALATITATRRAGAQSR